MMLVAVEDTPSYVWENDGWTNTTGNEGLTEPIFLTQHYIKHFTPNAKFIVIMRNPTERYVLGYDLKICVLIGYIN